jgi:hypothetical protein
VATACPPSTSPAAIILSKPMLVGGCKG